VDQESSFLVPLFPERHVSLTTHPDSQSLDSTRAVWNSHWQRQRRSWFGRLCSWYRRTIRARSVAWYFERCMPTSGVCVECGSGSSETSCRIAVGNRHLVAVDWSVEALQRAARIPQIAEHIEADIRSLPFAEGSIDGIWNLGVMEHFVEQEQQQILREFHRVLRPGGRVLLWWPPTHALDHWILKRFGRCFPSEPGRVTRQQAIRLMKSAGFQEVRVDFPWNDAWTELVVQGIAR